MNAKNTHSLDIPHKEWSIIKAQAASENGRVTYEEAAVALLCYGLDEYGKNAKAQPLEELVRRFNVPKQGLPGD